MSGPIVLRYSDLVAKADLTDQIEIAFGNDGIGFLSVEGVPGLAEARRGLLPLAKRFADLPEEVKNKYVHAESFYAFGWSHGKEKLDGNYDLAKGSYYGNPQYDRPVDDEALIQKYPAFIHPNIWPTEEIPEFADAFKRLGQLIVSVGILVAYQCDQYVHKKCQSYPADKLSRIIETSRCCKARLLHYFPLDQSVENSHDPFSSWCGWHNDHGSLTGLTSAMYLDADGNEVAISDPDAGLFIRNRQSELIKGVIPPDHIGFQIGESAQLHSGGILQATPHAVRGTTQPHISRETFAVFMEPMFDEPMNCPEGRTPDQTQSQTALENLPKGVSPLRARWNPSMNFGEFTDATLNSYH